MSTNESVAVELNVPQIMTIGYWSLLGVGALLIGLGFSAKEYGYLVTACFLGIVARVVQAEHHFRFGSQPSRGPSA